MTYKRTTDLQLRIVETIEIVNDDDKPSLPPMPIETTGVCVEETTKPLAKCVPLVRALRRVG